VGHKLGYPTANLEVDDPCKLIPARGVYAVEVLVDGHSYGGMLNIGCRPTLDNGTNRTIEVHIFDFDADIYHHPLRLTFVQRIRPERKFDSLDELAAQLHRDAAEARALLSLSR
jgi:riboflavin kinase/FMN adenylyltransferase